MPATYVAGRDGVIAYAFADPDWSRRAEPADIVAAVARLAQAADDRRPEAWRAACSARSTNALTGGE